MKSVYTYILGFVLLFSVQSQAVNSVSYDHDLRSKLTLSGQATILKPANQLQLSISVVTNSSSAEIALNENSQKMQEVINQLESLGLEKAEYSTGNFSIQPTYTPYPKDPPPNWSPSINGYEVTNSIAVVTTKLDLAGEIIDVANRAGANRIDNIRFSLKDARAYRDEVISAATANAFNDAKIIAQAAGVKLGRVISIKLEESNGAYPRVEAMHLAKGMATPPISAGEVTLSATVSVVFEIEE